ncbi:MFS transporter small subunit [Burkholderia cepacia]|nr:oxalate:formate antiporter [Burkholderia cepacia]MCA8348440.1 oxalate:formate antiporter [Burkholderia cepacia]
MNQAIRTRPTNKAALAAFWLYVLIPLTWGIVNTLTQALKLFG